ncbi:MAG: neutral/alkaline non-lysosomal ceramidase N-terminal domain-containing protein [Caldilineaceae bacterium]|nr:neutral/alkaline non-lysosomal ceramidase N-terminal domain-containing protein [Caldilineaceae bacterium]
MHAGFAEIIITPPQADCLLAGYSLYPATGVHDELYASAVYFQEGDTRALLISYDLLAMEKELIARLKQALQRALGLTPQAIFFTCTHTHEGPEVRERKFRDRWYGEERPAYLDTYLAFLADQTVAVAQAAQQQAQPCDLLVNRAYVDENLNRRFFLSDEQYLSIPANKQLAPIAQEHADKELGILAFCPVGARRPFGVIVNYTMHPLTAGHVSSLISADVPGVVRRLIKESMGCIPCYITGATGDNHPKAPEAGFAETERVGQVLATETIKRCYDAMQVTTPLRVRGLTRTVPLQLRTRTDFEKLPLQPGEGEATIRDNLVRVEAPGATVDVEFSLLAIGPVLLIGVPGELVAELGSVLKWFSPFKRTYIMYQATDSLDYIAHPNAYLWGGFETFCAQLSPTAVRPLINAILDAAEELSDYPWKA